MKKLSLFASVSAAPHLCAAVPVSFNNWSPASVTLFSLETAEARVGRPLTATSVGYRPFIGTKIRRAVGAAAVGGAAAGPVLRATCPAYEPEPSGEPGSPAYGEPAPYGEPALYGARAPYGVAEPAPYGEPAPWRRRTSPLWHTRPLTANHEPLTAHHLMASSHRPLLRRPRRLWRTRPLRRTTSSLWRTGPGVAAPAPYGGPGYGYGPSPTGIP